jgi:hypothetical protein
MHAPALVLFPHRVREKGAREAKSRERKRTRKDAATGVDGSIASFRLSFSNFELPNLFFSPSSTFLLLHLQSSFADQPADTTARTVVAVCLGLVGILMIGNFALYFVAQKSAIADGSAAAKKAAAAKKKVSKKKLKRETLRRGLPMPE